MFSPIPRSTDYPDAAMILPVPRRLTLALIATMAAMSPLGADDPAPAAWKSLFDGHSFAGWTTKSGKPVGDGWEARDGVLHRSGAGGDIVTTEQWLNFELEFEWKVAPKANSGLKYRVGDYAPAGNGIGPEYQVLDDDGHPNGSTPKTSAGSLYDLLPPGAAKKLKPVGEWNQSRVVARGAHIEHWLNGEKVVEIDLGSPAWRDALAHSKFKAAADFATKKGRILIQDHGDEAWFRGLRLRELPGA